MLSNKWFYIHIFKSKLLSSMMNVISRWGPWLLSRAYIFFTHFDSDTDPTKQKWHVGIRSVCCAKERRRVHIISIMALLVFNERAGSGRWKEVLWCIEMVQNDIHDLGTVFICTESTNCIGVSSTYRKYSSRSSIHRIPPLLLQQ
jgi:hypothetical protein